MIISIALPRRREGKRLLTREAQWLFLVIFPVLLCVILASDNFQPAKQARSTAVAPFSQEDSVVRVTITFIGDLMCHSPQFNNARQPDGSYDFNPSFEHVKPYFEASDYVIGNLETTTAGAAYGYAGYPNFNTPDSYIAALKYAGLDMLATSNNHSMDTGEKGLLRTLDVIDQNGLARTGTYRTQKDRDSVRIVDLKGMRIAILNYTYGTNGSLPAANHNYMLNVYDSSLVKNDIALARKQGAELVVVFYHWGSEYKAEPTPKQDTMMRAAANNGADMIIGSHPHVVGPVDFFKTKGAKIDTGLVAWTMGNFISNQSQHYTDAGLILNITLERNLNSGITRIASADYVPTWVYRAYDPAQKNYIVTPATWCGKDSLPQWISAESKAKICTSRDETKQVVQKYSSKVRLCR
jgi:poly-gamma-glutamate capsule biosynthesis protein CapA/YwtB (metallophosphatase superfamily)